MRILHVTDTHLGAERFIRGAPKGWARADDHLAAFAAALEPALREEVDLVVHSGDLFDRSRPPGAAAAAGAALIAEVGRRVPFVLIPGNHDRHGLSRHLPCPGPGVHVVDGAARVEVAGVALACVPFRRHADSWAADAARAWGGGADLLVAHQSFDGAWAPGIVFRAGVQRETVGAEQLPDGLRHVMCGHLHPRQVLPVGDATVVMPGSSERTSWVERDQAKGYAVWSLDRTVTWQFVDLPTRPLVVVHDPVDVDRVVPGALVRCADPALEPLVVERGGWVDGPPTAARPSVAAAPPQLVLF